MSVQHVLYLTKRDLPSGTYRRMQDPLMSIMATQPGCGRVHPASNQKSHFNYPGHCFGREGTFHILDRKAKDQGLGKGSS